MHLIIENMRQDIPLLEFVSDLFVPDIVMIELEGDNVAVSSAAMLSNHLKNCEH